MKTVVLGRQPEVDELIERRRALGQDGYDEVWDGEYHVVPMAHSRHARVQAALLGALDEPARRAGMTVYGPFSLGAQERNYRVPDGGLLRADPDSVYVPTAAVVVEVLSPDDETFDKFDFYAASGVEEILVADPATKTVRCWHRTGSAYVEADRSAVLDVSTAKMTAAIPWPA